MLSLKARQARYERMKAAKDAGATLEAIGAMEEPPLTKERVRVILSKPPKPNGRPPKEVTPDLSQP